MSNLWQNSSLGSFGNVLKRKNDQYKLDKQVEEEKNQRMLINDTEDERETLLVKKEEEKSQPEIRLNSVFARRPEEMVEFEQSEDLESADKSPLGVNPLFGKMKDNDAYYK